MTFGTRKVALALCLVIGLAACGDRARNHGFVPSDDQLQAVVVGRDTRVTVNTILGDPGSTGIVDETAWYYVRSTFEDGTYRALREVDREVVAVIFDEAGVVTNVERYGLEDGQVVLLSRRVTDANTAGIGFLQQLFGNLGQIDPAQFLQE
jgi:outer membrane protein assembly factor BamE (lipoprotein component of BamABCDE complex)